MNGAVQYKQIGIIRQKCHTRGLNYIEEIQPVVLYFGLNLKVQKSPSKNGSRKPKFECRLCGRERQNTKDNF